MKILNNILTVCYGYIAGIVISMLFPADAAHLPVLNVLSAILLGGGVAILAWRVLLRRPLTGPSQAVQAGLIILLLGGAVALGYSRHTAANTVPDGRVGEIRADGGVRTFHQISPLTDTHRLRIRKIMDIEQDLRFRIVGELDARVPVRNEQGAHRMDAQGRWLFTIKRMPITSDTVRVRADDPVDTDIVIAQPFTRIHGIEWIEGPSEFSFPLYRISNHIGSFVRPTGAQSAVTVLGRITGDPRVYDFKTDLIVTPAFIQFPAGGPYFKVDGGDIQVTVYPALEGYGHFARTSAYGADVQITGELTVASAESNPGGFNARRFMQNYNIYGLMRPFQPRNEPAPMQLIAPDGQPARSGHWLVAFSLELRDRILLLFKATMPYPQSAFLGGVTLGLRYGLQGAQFPGEAESPAWASRLGLGRSEARIVDDFRSSGVNHVLAVSGLHVTILTVMFIAIFSLLKFPKQVLVPFVIFALVVFAIITGARPSTLRAVIMNSLFLIAWGYLNQGLISSVLIGVPVAAFLILLRNPLVVVDPSFTLSFGAILSLALLTVPVHQLLSRLRGNRFGVVLFFVLASTLIGMVRWGWISAPSFFLPWLAIGAAAYILAGWLERRGWSLTERFSFAALPEGISTFISAQVSIQIGMMIPLSAYYFSRWPFAGAYANLIAIPLIGVVVQLGAIAGLLGLIPVIGPYLTLLLNAANWIFASFFLWLAHVSATLFPYPFVRRPRVIEIVIYYVFLAAFVWRAPLWKWICHMADRLPLRGPRAPVYLGIGLALLVVAPLRIAPPRDMRPPGLHVTVFSVGYGSAILVESPGSQRILIDAGFVEHERGRRNEAIRTLLPYFSHAAIRRLDALILTSPLPERAAGAAYVIDHMPVRQLIVPPMLADVSTALSRAEFEAMLSLTAGRPPVERMDRIYQELIGHPVWPQRPSLAKSLQSRQATPLNLWTGHHVQMKQAVAGDVLFAESVDGLDFRIDVLGPAHDLRSRALESRGLVLRVVYGNFSILLPGMLDLEGQHHLARSFPADTLQSTVMVAPHHGTAFPPDLDRPDREQVWRGLTRYTLPLLEAVRSECIIFEFGNPRPVLDTTWRSAINVFDATTQFVGDFLEGGTVLRTDRDRAIMIHSDGESYAIDTQALRNRARGGDEDAVSDLAIGL